MKKNLKEKLKNKFILIIILAILSILWIQYLLKPEIDTNTYVVLVKWEVNISETIDKNKEKLNKEDRKKLEIWNIIITKKDSACVIEWWDWSLTRLWENSKVEIQELNVKEDLSKINLQFKLINWKTWSNVVSYLWEESYFKQNFEDIEAAVRWTIFDVNLDKDYVYVANHEVAVKNEKETKIIRQNQAFSIKTFSFIEIEKFLKNIVDKKWLEENAKLDTKFLDNLKKNISEKIDLKNIDQILDKNKTYKELLSQYQKLNFVSASDSDLFEVKNKIKKELINIAPEEEKQNLIKYSIYDLNDALNLDSIDSTTKETIGNITKLVWNNTSDLQNILWEKYSDFENILDKLDIKWTVDKLKWEADKLRDSFLKSLNK